MRKVTAYLPDELYERIAGRAEAERRSMAAQILFELAGSKVAPAPRKTRCEHGIAPTAHCKTCDP